MVQRSIEKKQNHISETENITSKCCTKTGAQKYDRKLSDRLDRDTEWNSFTFWKISEISYFLSAVTDIRAMRSSNEGTDVSYTKLFTRHQKQLKHFRIPVLVQSYSKMFSIPLSCQVIYSQFGLAIHQNDHQARRRFVKWAQNEIAVVPDFHKRILFSDEAHFWLNGYVNKQNCRIWSEANSQVYVETPLHPEKLTVWCTLRAGAVVPTRRGTCHTARATIDLLKDTFGDRLISRFGLGNWPPRSCDLTPLDYFLWGYVKSLVYAYKPQTPDHLEDNIRRVIADIRPQMLEKVIENWTSRLDYIRASRGSPMPEIIFKM
ncbi:putative LOC100569746 [Trichonephila clavipes]|nr:putative LOC100569746 [Trichonephila clavipes]